MHAASDSAAPVGKRAAVALAAALSAVLAGCSTSSSDQAALSGPSSPVTTVAASTGGPTVTFTGASAHVAGHPAATAALDRVPVAPSCSPTVKRSDGHLVSLIWRCGADVRSATVTLDGRRLALGDILQGNYGSYLSSAASAQFSAEGQQNASTTDLGTWYLTPAALAVAFPAGVVSYPLASLGAYLKDPSAL